MRLRTDTDSFNIDVPTYDSSIWRLDRNGTCDVCVCGRMYGCFAMFVMYVCVCVCMCVWVWVCVCVCVYAMYVMT